MRKVVQVICLLAVLSLCSVVICPEAVCDDATDIVLHSTVSAAISIGAYNIYKNNTGMSDRMARFAAFLTSMGVGFIKELTDSEISGTDLGADAAGAGAGAVFAFEF